LLFGIVVALLLFCCLIGCCLAGIAWWSLEQEPAHVEGQSLPASDTTTWEPAIPLSLSNGQRTARELAETTLPQRDLLALAHRLLAMPLSAGQEMPEPSSYALGDSATFWLHNVDTASFYTTTATLRYETAHAYWWVEEGYQALAENIEESAWNFENVTYATNQRFFGSEWNPGIDGDPHIYIFLGYVPGVGGYFSGPDEYPAQIRAYSNEHEMFYINLRNARPGNDYFDGILAHEHQHMIHWALDRNEDTWVNEGLSELAAQVSGFDVGGSDAMFSLVPDTQLTTWPELEDSGPHYGASYLFMAYFLEQYGEQAIRRLVAEPDNGAAGVDAVLAAIDADLRRFDDLFADWVVANYLDDLGAHDLGSPPGSYGYADLQIRQPTYAALHAQYPVHQQADVHQYATDYIILEGKKDLVIEFDGRPTVPLVGNEPHSGQYQWWHKQGDEGDAILTRAFDLTGLQEASLQAWMWYDLEADFDYAYVEVSPDAGQTWHLLANEHTTVDDPNGSSYGPAFTGTSGGAETPRWVLETFDLSPYAGRSILVRFEVITDESVTRPGLCLDDISIPELGYRHDAEAGQDGWLAEGWVQVTAHIPQSFVVQLITIGDETNVERLTLDGEQRGTIPITGLGRDIDRAVLIVSALAPHTTQPAAYRYRITEQ
jgi:immune inhibitor A